MRRLFGQPWYYPVVFTCFGLAFAGWGAIDGNIWTDEQGRAQLWEAHERRTGVLEGRPDETVPTAVSRRQAEVVTGEKNIARLRQMLQAAARRRGA